VAQDLICRRPCVATKGNAKTANPMQPASTLFFLYYRAAATPCLPCSTRPDIDSRDSYSIIVFPLPSVVVTYASGTRLVIQLSKYRRKNFHNYFYRQIETVIKVYWPVSFDSLEKLLPSTLFGYIHEKSRAACISCIRLIELHSLTHPIQTQFSSPDRHQIALF
jgi:hypothetical protein